MRRQRTHAIPSRPRAPRPPLGARPRPRPPLHVTASRNQSCHPPPTNIPPPFFLPSSSHLPPQRAPPPENIAESSSAPAPLASSLYTWSSRGDRCPPLASRLGLQSMCHPGLPPGCAARRRERQAGASPLPSAPTRARQAQPYHYCVCSPTAHRGSFRCRWHRVGYEWGRWRPLAREGAGTTARAGADQAIHERMAAA
ncbi:hypothetical protein GQ55_5G136100 [Panicum hallii var. hallii]|uniref:Uncharacterized protein n=1 Tax=Panicum hallii var. hallii TaxID=1504633 RepID=A0A2T7DFX5_9POAL|nr:hypothetical protein GQ55_5G136100 [Panicum hallii var. hallii]